MTGVDSLGPSDRPLGQILLDQGKLNEEQLGHVLEFQKESRLPLGEELLKRGMISSEDLNAALAQQYGLPILEDPLTVHLGKEWFAKIPYAFVRRHLILPLREDGDALVVAVADPMLLEPLEELRFICDREIRAEWAPRQVIMSGISSCYDAETGAASQLLADLSEKGDEGRGDGEPAVYDLLESSQNQPAIIRLLNLILTEAIQQGASDVHFEPEEDGLRVRYRIDGVLQIRHSPAPEYQGQLLTRIKVMAKLDIAERRLPQDGRIKLRMGGKEIDLRVSTVPVVHGERIVLRILSRGNVMLGLDQVGMSPTLLESFRKLVELPEGIILVTGPTGSGKTTTLYSALSERQDEETNIMTIEDPVEYKLKGIAQIQVKPKIQLTFAAGLRTILRQDPDVVMVGEIRDVETAEIAIQASLTGHLVFSTLHTNDAPSAVTRLVDMGIEPYLICTSVVGILAQRLLRRICPSCKEAYRPSDEALEILGLERDALEEGVLYRGRGCQECYGSGYKGRHGIYELMLVSNAIKRQILQSPDGVAIREIALRQGMRSLRQEGAALAVLGVTTDAEVLRVTRGLD
jgi:general secretion pathway protein E